MTATFLTLVCYSFQAGVLEIHIGVKSSELSHRNSKKWGQASDISLTEWHVRCLMIHVCRIGA